MSTLITSLIPHLLLLTLLPLLLPSTSQTTHPAEPFKCNITTPRCKSVVSYTAPNKTTLLHIKHLFNVKNFRSLLGANDLPPSTPLNTTLHSKQSINIPFPCLCQNGTGVSAKRPVYSVAKDDGIYHIAMDVFSGLSSVDMVVKYNNIKDKDLIKVGQKLWIPLPCSCDKVDAEMVVHFGYVVPDGGEVEQIAEEFGSSEESLMKLNGISDDKKLFAGQVLDVPLKACTTMINSTSLDYPLLVANGTYTFTANNCVMCKCDAANNWTLQCQPSGLKPSKWSTCPSMECTGDGNLTMGNSTNSACGQTTCAYAGYTSEKILTTTSMDSTCSSGSGNDVSMVHLKNWSLIVAAVILTQFIML